MLMPGDSLIACAPTTAHVSTQFCVSRRLSMAGEPGSFLAVLARSGGRGFSCGEP